MTCWQILPVRDTAATRCRARTAKLIGKERAFFFAAGEISAFCRLFKRHFLIARIPCALRFQDRLLLGPLFVSLVFEGENWLGPALHADIFTALITLGTGRGNSIAKTSEGDSLCVHAQVPVLTLFHALKTHWCSLCTALWGTLFMRCNHVKWLVCARLANMM